MQIEELKEKLSSRNDNGKSRDFIEVYGNFVESYLRYKEWTGSHEERYHGVDYPAEHIKENIDLIESILKYGLIEPIYIHKDKHGVEIDGYHRLIILDKLGYADSNGTSRR